MPMASGRWSSVAATAQPILRKRCWLRFKGRRPPSCGLPATPVAMVPVPAGMRHERRRLRVSQEGKSHASCRWMCVAQSGRAPATRPIARRPPMAEPSIASALVGGDRLHQRDQLTLYRLVLDLAVGPQQPQAERAVEEEQALDLTSLVVTIVEEGNGHIEGCGDLLKTS